MTSLSSFFERPLSSARCRWPTSCFSRPSAIKVAQVIRLRSRFERPGLSHTSPNSTRSLRSINPGTMLRTCSRAADGCDCAMASSCFQLAGEVPAYHGGFTIGHVSAHARGSTRAERLPAGKPGGGGCHSFPAIDWPRCANYRSRPALFDHLVSAGEQHGRDDQAECLSCLEVDDKFVSSRLLHRQVGWLGAVQDFIHQYSSQAIEFGFHGVIAHQSAFINQGW